MTDVDHLTVLITKAADEADCVHLPAGEVCGGCVRAAVNVAVTDWRDNLAEQITALSIGVPEPENGGYLDGFDDAVELAAGLARSTP